MQYKDYAFEENNKSIEKQKNYWIEKFDRPITALDLPLDYKRPKKQSFKGNHISKGISPILRDKINKFMMDKGVSKNMIYLSALGILFSQYSREEMCIRDRH